jgi:hypothetical protein
MALVLAGSVFTAAFVALPASADWPTLGRQVTADIRNQNLPQVATDAASGAIIVWQDFRDKQGTVFARRVLASGELDPAWPVDGLEVLSDSAANDTAFLGQALPVIVSDGTGGAIIAWQDGRSEVNALDIFAQHVLRSGVVDPAWPANGRALCTVRADQQLPKIASDGAGGAIVSWMDDRSSATGTDIFAQHVRANGTVDPAWPDGGVALCTAPSLQAHPQLISDGTGGAIVTWHDFRSSTTSADIFAQHVTNSGVVDPAWPSNGRALTLVTGAQLEPTITTDGLHGAIVAWQDARAGVSHIFAQHVLGSGAIAPGWPANGRAVAVAGDDEVQPLIVSDGAAPGAAGSGAIVTWLDDRSGVNHNPYVQHVLATGSVDPAWPVDGRALSLSTGEEITASIVGDGSGGAIVSWEEDSFVFVNHVRASGVLDPTFPVNGRFVRLLLTFQHHPALVAAGSGGAIVAWDDQVTADANIFATIVPTEATAGVDPGVSGSGLALSRRGPSPSRGPVTLSFALPHSAAVRLAIFDISGRRVRELVSGMQAGGTHDVVWDLRDERGERLPAGISFARLEVDGRSLSEKLVTLR